MSRLNVRVASATEVAKAYRIRKATVLAAIRSGKLPARRRGRAWACSLKRAEELFGAEGHA